MSSPLSILRDYWKYDQFRPMQEDIIQSVLDGKDTLALLPTGGGKSLCFQVPALVKPGLCLVISPLIALMKDQVENLRKKGITALSIHSGMDRKEVINALKIAGNSNCKFLYISPERLQTSLFKEYLPSFNINLLAIDEAHCISQWGYDFRPAYLRIAELRSELNDVPVLALTASATSIVQDDICEKLACTNKNIFRQSFERPNLSYSVFKVDSKINKVLDILNKVPGSSIIYCRSRKQTVEIANLLQLHKIPSSHYHAGLSTADRSEKQEAWINGSIRVMVSTNAFGMGIDKPDVRTVIHADIPDSLENYYQEAGRAGRDGKRSFAVLLYREQELKELEAQPAIHFPDIESIRSVYQSLINYLQLPAGSGKENYFDFDLRDFISKFKLDLQLVIHSLKTLEQEEVVSFNEQVFVPSTIQFTSSKKTLFELEQSNPAIDKLVKTLLRTYEGIFDFPVSINEKFIARLTGKDEAEIRLQLQQLHQADIIEYRPQKDSPQLYWFENAVRPDELRLNTRNIAARKEAYTKRIRSMIEFTSGLSNCRSQFIASYFGDPATKACGVCDYCLSKKEVTVNETEYVDIHMRLMKLLHRPQHAKDLISQLVGIRKEKAWKVIDHLQSENKIEVDGEGMVRKK